jgi:transposase-like protein
MGLIPLPSDDEVVKAWREHDKNNSATARHFGVNESTIRKAVTRETGRKPRAYRRLPLAGQALYGAFLKEGGDRGAASRLARSYGVKPQSVSAALRRYLDRVDPVN